MAQLCASRVSKKIDFDEADVISAACNLRDRGQAGTACAGMCTALRQVPGSLQYS